MFVIHHFHIHNEQQLKIYKARNFVCIIKRNEPIHNLGTSEYVPFKS